MDQTSSVEAEKLTPLFDSLANQPPETPTSQDNKKSPLDFYTPEVEKYGAGLFDQAVKGRLQSLVDPLRYAAHEALMERYKEMARNNASRSLTGQSFDELPEPFQKDYLLWEEGSKRPFQLFSYKAALKFVDAFSSLFDLSKEP